MIFPHISPTLPPFSGELPSSGFRSLPQTERAEKSVTRCGFHSFPLFSTSGRLDSNQRPLDPQSKGASTQPLSSQKLSTREAGACTNACTSDGENGRSHADRLEVIAELLTDLPAAGRAEIIGRLSPDDRLAVAQFLAMHPVRESEEQARHKG